MSATLIHPLDAFKTAMLGAGLAPPDDLQDDGQIHRFSTSGKRKDDAGWYVVHTDGVPAGSFGCWRTGMTQTWCAVPDDELTVAEREAHQQRVQAMRAQRDADTAERQQLAAAEAMRRWQAATPATPATAHPYLVAKGIQAHGVRVEGAALIVPMRDAAGDLRSLQTIDPAGEKRFQYGGQVKGCYHALGKPDGVLIVCEGYATGASIHEATGHAVAVAFNAGNLEAVAKALASKYPALRLIVAGDDDWQTPGNPGATHARAAALAVGALVAMPQFPADRGAGDTDMNDLHRCAGLEAVRACFAELEVFS